MVSFVKPALAAGEIAPALYGRIDLPKWHQGLSVARNMLVSYRGGLMSRAGTLFAGISKQPATAAPPRLIKFKFNLFQSYELEFGDLYMRVLANGAYVTETAFAITGITNANPGVVTCPGHNFANGDAVFIANVQGMTQVDGVIFIAQNVTATTFTLQDAFGVPVNTFNYPAYAGGGTAARIYTLTTPYLAADLPYLKFDQSADVMSICCVNQSTQTDYPPMELTRLAANNWTLAQPAFGSTIAAPTMGAVTASVAGSCAFGYVVTAVDAVTGDESIASAIGQVLSAVNIATTFGTITINWTAPAGKIQGFNIYKCTPDFTNTGNFAGQIFGFVGTAGPAATSWHDTNIIADFAITPPLHVNPFPSPGNYPGDIAYFQQRRAYAYTLNAPDTYQLSQPGAYLNFDAADPTVASDAIVGTPWGQMVNGVQAMVPMPGGLVTMSGENCWLVSGTGGSGSPITPSQQSAQPHESNGCSPTVPPVRINFDVLFVQSQGSVVRDLQFSWYMQMYTGTDLTVLSSHLFLGHSIVQWAWAREPYKVMWCVREDGKLVPLTYLKEQELVGWTRADTNGLVVSIATASEPPVDAVYWVVKRYVAGKMQWAYFVERMDNRLWPSIEQCWCVDAGLALPMPAPNATLTASAAQPTGGILSGTVISGGHGYTAPVGQVADPTGSGAVVNSITVVGGAITAVNVSGGKNYTAAVLQVTDVIGSGGATFSLAIDNTITFAASTPVFSAGNIGSVIRMGGGKATITAAPSGTSAIAAVTAPILATIPNDPNNMPVPAAPGQWTMTAPVSAVTGLGYLEGMTVTGLADGGVIPPAKVVNGQIALAQPASAITIGLPFICQAQLLHADLPGAMVQGKRKRIPGVTVRIASTRGIKVGVDQPIAATLPFGQEIPWGQLPYGPLTEEIDFGGSLPANVAPSLFTGDKYFRLASDWNTADGQASPGMVAFQQDYPLPFELLAVIPDVEIGDTEGG